MRVPTIDLAAQYRTIEREIDEAVKRVFSHSYFVLGKELEQFEDKLSKYIGAKYALGVASGTDALSLSLFALGIGEGDEVITTPFTFGATAEVIALLRAKPVFVDIDRKSMNLNPDMIEDGISRRTKAILPVHLYGLCADMKRIQDIALKHDLKVIEDAAQAVGSRIGETSAGCFGDIAGMSFYPTKNLGAAGDGGAVLTNDDTLYGQIRMLRVHGIEEKYQYQIIGFNNRLDAIQAAVLGVKLEYLRGWNERRRAIASQYTEALKDHVTVPIEPEGYYSVYHQYTIRTDNRDALREHLGKKGVGAAIHYPAPLHLQPAFSYLGYEKGDFPEAEAAADEVLSLPMYPELTDEQVGFVIEQACSFFEG